MRRIYAIRDLKAECWSPMLITCAARGEALREFQTAVNNRESPYGRYPADFVLYEIGLYDDVEGVVIPQDAVNLGSGSSYVMGPKLVEEGNVRASD